MRRSAARRLGKEGLARRLEAEAGLLAERFEAAFWCPELHTYALALDGDKQRRFAIGREPVRLALQGRGVDAGITKKGRVSDQDRSTVDLGADTFARDRIESDGFAE